MSYWRQFGPGVWKLFCEGQIQAEIKKEAGKWYARVLPMTSFHIGPLPYLSWTMSRVAKYMDSPHKEQVDVENTNSRQSKAWQLP